MLGNSNAENISVLEPHSDAIYDYRFGDKFRALYPDKHTRPDGWTVDYQLVLPDAGAVERYEYLAAKFVIQLLAKFQRLKQTILKNLMVDH